MAFSIDPTHRTGMVGQRDGDSDMELALNEINAAIIANSRWIYPQLISKQFGRGACAAAFRAANMDGYSKRGGVWHRD